METTQSQNQQEESTAIIKPRVRRSVITRSLIRNNLRLYNIIEFTLNEIPNIMGMLDVPFTDYSIGGSVAAYLRGITYNRGPHDIDIIVSSETLNKIKILISTNALFMPVVASYDEEHQINHFAFRSIRSPIIDIIACDEKDTEKDSITTTLFSYKPCNINIASVKHLIESKRKYNRRKDIDDLVLLEEHYAKYYNINVTPLRKRSVPLEDIQALKELKDKMENNNEK